MMSILGKSQLVVSALAMLGGTCMAGDIQGTVTAQGMKSPASIVVYVDAVAGKEFDPPSTHAVVHQKKMTFIPHVLAVQKGTQVDFWNDDPVDHGVSWPSVGGNKKLAHHLGIWPQGEMKSFTFDDLGAVPLLCFLHPEMSGYILVVPTPYFAVTDENGNFQIKDLPPGSYTLKTWSEGGESVLQTIEVANGPPITVDLTVRRFPSR